MISDVAKLCELFAKLATTPKRNQQIVFREYVEPTFEVARRVYEDYLKMLDELKDMIRNSDTALPIMEYLNRRRTELLPDRTVLRADVELRVCEGKATRFDVGILGLLSGVSTGVSRPYFQTYSYDEQAQAVLPQLGRHTVLDILAKLQEKGQPDITAVRPRLMAAVEAKRHGIDEAWKNVAVGHAELRKRAQPRWGVDSGARKDGSAEVGEILSLLVKMHDMLERARSLESAAAIPLKTEDPTSALDRSTPKRFVERVKRAFPGALDLHHCAEKVRWEIHDYVDKQPHAELDHVAGSLDKFEQEFSVVIKRSAT
jgi:hypothetical protein